MSKTTIFAILAICIIAIGVIIWRTPSQNTPQKQTQDPKNLSYIIGNSTVTLVNGVSEVPVAPGSASKTVTRYFGNELIKDIDGDGKNDVVFLLTQETGGSGVFYYAAAALATSSGYVGTHALLIGDRIAPQTTSSGPGRQIIVNYADRKPGEPFTTAPSVGKSLYLLLDAKTLQFGEVVQNFEGEADPGRMSLGMKKWDWIKTQYNDGKEIIPKTTGKFSLTFKSDSTFSATTDCNSASGTYSVKEKTIEFSRIMSTKMYCQGSQEADFLDGLSKAQSYFFTSKGELIFDMKYDSGTIIFK